MNKSLSSWLRTNYVSLTAGEIQAHFYFLFCELSFTSFIHFSIGPFVFLSICRHSLYSRDMSAVNSHNVKNAFHSRLLGCGFMLSFSHVSLFLFFQIKSNLISSMACGALSLLKMVYYLPNLYLPLRFFSQVLYHFVFINQPDICLCM